MFTHVSIGVSDFSRALAFYDAVMDALGHQRLFGEEADGFMAYGPPECFFIINTPLAPERGTPKASNGSHLCFAAQDADMVRAFHATALAHGGRDDGPPGLRPHYAADYFAAFILDPDGHKIEAVARVSG